jgi:hypothetical protein
MKIIFNSKYLKKPIVKENGFGFSQEEILNLLRDGYDFIIVEDSSDTIIIPYLREGKILYKRYMGGIP